MITLGFNAGTLTAEGDLPPDLAGELFRSDPRTGNCRARGCDYARIMLRLQCAGIRVTDRAREYRQLDTLSLKENLKLRPHQEQAFDAWKNNQFRGVAALPTGSGKTILAVYAINFLKRSTLVLVPTIDLLVQWVNVLERFFGPEIGMLGGGSRDIRDITVSTYDSAVLNMEYIGSRFGLLIADECHHLPGPETRLAAAMCIAPFRLGLTATPELPEDRAWVLEDLMGSLVCRIAIDELKGKVLSPYVLKLLPAYLDADEAQRYRACRETYTAFLRHCRISFRSPEDWGRFLIACGRQPGGREAFSAYLEQRRISRSGRDKIRKVWEIIRSSAPESRILIFTADNAAAYEIGRTFFLPVITHHTPANERKLFLENFRSGKYRILVTSQVLNEGVDVPEASVGIVVSGTGSRREHVQRLGRILRPAPGKRQAVLYEIVSAGTSEEYVSNRRRTGSGI